MKEMLFSLRKLKVMAICLVLFAVLIPIHSVAAEEAIQNSTDGGSGIGTTPLGDYWTDGSEAAKSLNDYLLAVTDETSPDYIPEENRIAVFDLDGTLMCETYPFCFEYMVFSDYALNHAEEMPEDVLAVAQEIKDATGGEKPSGMSTRQASAAAIAYKGMTMPELAKVVEDFKSSEAWGFTGMTRGEAWYKPMVELFGKLQENGFTLYVVSATERNIVRQVVAGTLNIPPSHVIGTEYGYTATNQGDEADADYTFQPDDKIVFDGNYFGENAKTSKVDAIVREIGRQPVLAFGNSSGDLAMEVYTISGNPYRSAAYMVLADDAEREYGDPDGAAEKKESYEKMGLRTISMRDDFRTIYGDGVMKDDTARYQLEQVVALSRHNLRAPLASNGSVPQELTPHKWMKWTAPSSELSVKGGIQETSMGQYFRKWMDKEGLIPENSIPEEGEVRFNARDKQRCRATARYFASGMLPLADITVEYPSESNNLKDFMSPKLKFYSDDFAVDATAEAAALCGDGGFNGATDKLREDIKLIMDTVDMKDSKVYRSGKYGDLLTDGSGYKLEEGKEPEITGALKTANQMADALILQYYEEPDAKKAAFGHDLTKEDWGRIGGLMTKFMELRYGVPMVSVNVTHPLIQELESELKNEKRKFSFLCAHDCIVFMTLCALGAEPYTLPDCIESKTPMGVKILFERWRDREGQAWYRAELVYRTTEQIRESSELTLDNPPEKYNLSFEGVATNEDGMISEADFFGMFDRTLAEYDHLVNEYTEKKLDTAA